MLLTLLAPLPDAAVDRMAAAAIETALEKRPQAWWLPDAMARTLERFGDADPEHRLMRERQVVAALEDGLTTVAAMVPRLYADVHPALHPAAALTVRAHLEKLVHDGVVRAQPDDRFALAC